MKRAALCVVLAFLSMSAFAASPFRAEAKKRFAAPEIVTAVSTLASATGARDVQAQVTTEAGASIFVFPIMGNAAGSGGTYFRSDTTMINNLNRPQRIAIFYFPANGSTCNGIRPVEMVMQPLTWYVWPDFVGSVFGQSGLGSVAVAAIDANGNADPSGNIDGFSRIWTPVPGGSGYASQSFPPSAVSFYQHSQWAYGLRHDASFRTNVGVFNYLPTGNPQPRIFDVIVFGLNDESEMTLTVPPCSMALQVVPNRNYGALIVGIKPRDSFGGWYGFASSVDNNSGDNWSSSARP